MLGGDELSSGLFLQFAGRDEGELGDVISESVSALRVLSLRFNPLVGDLSSVQRANTGQFHISKMDRIDRGGTSGGCSRTEVAGSVHPLARRGRRRAQQDRRA